MISGGISRDGLSKGNVGSCGVSGVRVRASFVCTM